MKIRIISLFLLAMCSLSIFGCNMEDSHNANTNINHNNSDDNYTQPTEKELTAVISNLEAGRYKVLDFNIKIMSSNELNWNEKKVIVCSIVDKHNKNKIKTFFTDDSSMINLFYLDNDEESYLENTNDDVSIYISKEMAKTILN